ncbi:MAG TPA: 2-oxoacid:acceptor oxidoreductase subunit alpha [bacterium]|nr:2-oxoacid:acceptor oxidoreductase subunit alpha [bacterium]
MTRDVAWLIGGKTGEGVDSAGEIFARAAARAGAHVHTFRLFPPIIKGGPTSYEVRAADGPVTARADVLDCVIALDDDTAVRHGPALGPDGLLLTDEGRPGQPAAADVGRRAHGAFACTAPLTALARESGDPIMKNMVALGASARLLGLDVAVLRETVRRRFADKHARVQEQNTAAVDRGWRYAEAHLDGRLPGRALPRAPRAGRWLLSGNDAIALGALAAGCRLYASYPITPASDILEWMAAHLPDVGGAALQTEDEIAALGVVIGAGYAGVRAMTATSGPGLSLMTETIGLAGMAEIPAVIVAAQRPGPSAGMPTKHEQGDFLHMVYAAHGEFPRIVLTPGSVEECFTDAALAFNLAERYQCPVIVGVDQDLVLSRATVAGLPFDEVRIDRGDRLDDGEAARTGGTYERYALTPSGISPRAVPGQPGLRFLSSGDAHDRRGVIDVEDPSVRRAMVDKRLRKTREIGRDAPGVEVDGEGDVLVISLGAPCGPLREAAGRLRADGVQVRVLRIRRLWPFPTPEVTPEVARARRVVVVEHNATGQIATLLLSHVGGHDKVEGLRQYNGLPFRPADIEAGLRAAAGRPGAGAGR